MGFFVDFREHRCCLVSIISEKDSTMFGSRTENDVALFSKIKRRELSVCINKTVACFLLLSFYLLFSQLSVYINKRFQTQNSMIDFILIFKSVKSIFSLCS